MGSNQKAPGFLGRPVLGAPSSVFRFFGFSVFRISVSQLLVGMRKPKIGST